MKTLIVVDSHVCDDTFEDGNVVGLVGDTE